MKLINNASGNKSEPLQAPLLADSQISTDGYQRRQRRQKAECQQFNK